MPDLSDALVIGGAALIVASVLALAGLWWGVGLLGVLLILAGLFGGR